MKTVLTTLLMGLASIPVMLGLGIPNASADPDWVIVCRTLEAWNTMGFTAGLPMAQDMIRTYGEDGSKAMVQEHCASYIAIWAIAASNT